MAKYRYSKSQPLLPVDGVPVMGKLYHPAWGYSRGIVGKCVAINHTNQTVILQTPKTKRDFQNPVRWDELRHTRKEQFNMEHSQKTKFK